MNNFNFSVIEGNLIEDPKKLGDGYVFKISSTRTWRDKYGNNKEEVTFFDVMVKDKLWKNCYKYLKKKHKGISIWTYDKQKW